MNANPFLTPGAQRTPLELEVCQRIHYHAIRAAVRGTRPEALPASLPIGVLTARARFDGPEVYLVHPATIQRLFAGVTLAVFRAVRLLYCSRIGRSIKMVWRVLRAMACAAGVEYIPYETIWALCLYLEECRKASVAVPVERGQDMWWVGLTLPDISIQEETAREYRPSIAWCVEVRIPRALSFRIAPQEAGGENVTLALYDAILAHRRPHPRVATGLIWYLPQRIITTVPLSQPCITACTRVGIQVEESTASIPFLDQIRETWERGVAGRTLSVNHCAGLLDTYLRKIQQYGPLRDREEHARAYTPLIGYNQDPAWQFPLLREFLPLYSGSITTEGEVPFGGLHYTHEFLSYWSGCPVTLRRSTHTAATAWIYLDGEILCQAHARELRRHDGSYRLYQSER